MHNVHKRDRDVFCGLSLSLRLRSTLSLHKLQRTNHRHVDGTSKSSPLQHCPREQEPPPKKARLGPQGWGKLSQEIKDKVIEGGMIADYPACEMRHKKVSRPRRVKVDEALRVRSAERKKDERYGVLAGGQTSINRGVTSRRVNCSYGTGQRPFGSIR